LFVSACDAIAELAADSRGTPMLPLISGGRKPTRHNNSAALNGYKRTDGIQFGKSRLLVSRHSTCSKRQHEAQLLQRDRATRCQLKYCRSMHKYTNNLFEKGLQ